MNTQPATVITIETTVNAPVGTVWESFNSPEHITKWNSASDDWHTPWAKNDLRVGGTITSRMEAKDGSMGFDFTGTYDEIRVNEYIAYTLADGRKVTIRFTTDGNSTSITESFEAETENSVELQQMGWQAILNSFKKYTEQL